MLHDPLAALAFDYTTTPRNERPGIIVPPDPDARPAALADVGVPLRPHCGVGGVAPREAEKLNRIPAGEFEPRGLSRDACSLISVAGDLGIARVVDQRQGVHGMIGENLFVPGMEG